jgi:chemotaxis protein MotA
MHRELPGIERYTAMKKKTFREMITSRNAIGLLLSLSLFLWGFTIHGNLGYYFNLAGLMIVVGGTIGATLLNFKYSTLAIVYKVLVMSYRTIVRNPEEIVEILVDLSVKSKIKGVLALQEDEKETSLLFLRQALGYLVDGYNSQQIRDVLNSEMYFFKARRDNCERVLRTVSNYCPSFGLIGSVVGLIGMLAGVGSTEIILATVPIALTSTLYGIVFANFFFTPFAGRLREKTNQELLLKKMIMEGIIAIQNEVDPRVLERKLKSFLTPSARHGKLVSLQKIRERFNIPAEPPSPQQR